MKTIIVIALITAILTIGLATAGPVNMAIYDINEDMQIDATERIILDIDIENSRISNAEASVIDSYTTDGTVILNDEFQAAFLNADKAPAPTVISVEIIEDVPTPAPPVVKPTTTPVDSPPVTAENIEKTGSLILPIMGLGIIILIMWFAFRKADEEE